MELLELLQQDVTSMEDDDLVSLFDILVGCICDEEQISDFEMVGKMEGKQQEVTAEMDRRGLKPGQYSFLKRK